MPLAELVITSVKVEADQSLVLGDDNAWGSGRGGHESRGYRDPVTLRPSPR